MDCFSPYIKAKIEFEFVMVCKKQLKVVEFLLKGMSRIQNLFFDELLIFVLGTLPIVNVSVLLF